MNNNNNNNNIFIDGPLNIITIKGMNKEMTLIADFHEDAKLEIGCNVPESIQLEKFIEHKLEKTILSKDKLHFFIETIPSNHIIQSKILEEELRFSDKMIKFLLDTFDKPGNMEGITKISHKYPNVILHFIDIRNLIFVNMDSYFIELIQIIEALNCTSFINCANNDNIIKNTKDVINKINKLMSFTYDSLYNMTEQSSIELEKQYDSMNDKNMEADIAIKLIVNKIKTSYENKYLGDQMKKYINEELKTNFNEFFNLGNEINEYMDNLCKNKHQNEQHRDTDGGVSYTKSYPEFKDEIHKLANHLLYKYNHLWFVDLTSKIMDLYLIRIFLNSDIEKAITFTGIEHTMFIIYFLVKYLNFNIENTSLLNDITLDQLMDKIKNNSGKEFHTYLFPKKLTQCSTGTGFTVI